MSLTPCSFVSGARPCHYKFKRDGHSLCVTHRPCVSPGFVFDPLVCEECSEHIKFLRLTGEVDRLSNHFSSIRRSWAAVRRSAKRRSVSPAWKDPALMAFVFGGGPSSSTTTASTGPVSPPSGSVVGPTPGPSSAPDPVGFAGFSEPLPTAPSTSPPPPPAPAAGASASALTPDVLREVVAAVVSHLSLHGLPGVGGAAVDAPPCPSGSRDSSAPPTDPPARGSATGPARSPSPLGSYAVASSPISEEEGSDVTAQAAPLLPAPWTPIPSDWVVSVVDGVPVPFCRGDSSTGLVQVMGQEVCWGSSVYAPGPGWFFRPQVDRPPEPSSLPVPPLESVSDSFAVLAVLAGLSPPSLQPPGSGPARPTVGLPWMDGWSDPFFRPLRECWSSAAGGQRYVPPPRRAPRQAAPVGPIGASLDSSLAGFLVNRSPWVFPPPLSTPSPGLQRKCEASQAAASEAFSGFQTILAIERIIDQLSLRPGVNGRLSAAVLCQHLLPLLRSAIWQWAPTVSTLTAQSLSDLMALWVPAVSSLPASAQTAILLGDPLSSSFGSPQAVSTAVTSAPQFLFVSPRQASRPSSSRPRGSAQRRLSSRPRPPVRPARDSGRYRPAAAPSRPGTSRRDRVDRHDRSAGSSARPAAPLPFHSAAAGREGRRR